MDNMRAQAAKLFANVDAVTFQTKSKSYVINARELEIGSLWIVPYEGEMGNYDKTEAKTGENTVAMEWRSIPPRLPHSDEGIWPAPTNAEEDALCKVRPGPTACNSNRPQPRSPSGPTTRAHRPQLAHPPAGKRAGVQVEPTHSAMATGPS